MRNKIYLIFLVCFILKLNQINSEPTRRYYARYPPPSPSYNENNNNSEYDYLNNVSLGRLLSDDNQLIQQTEHLDGKIKTSIASKLMGLANRLQHAANILLLDGTSGRRRSHRPISTHRLKHNNNYSPKQNPPYSRPSYDNNESPRPYDSNNQLKPFDSSRPNTTPKSPSLGENLNSDIEIINPKPTSSKPNFPVPPKMEDFEILDPKDNGKEDKIDKKKEDELLNRSKRQSEYDDDSSFRTVTKRQLNEVSNEVRTGYNNVIKLLKKYLDDPPALEKPETKRDLNRVEQLLENIEQAKKIFIQIEDYVSRQYLENTLENRNQTELLNYFDKIIRVEKTRIGQALNEYDTQLAPNYKPVVYESSLNNKPSRSAITEYQDDEDHERYLNERRKEIERENRRTPIRNYEYPAEEKLISGFRNQQTEKPTILIRRVYIPPTRKSRPIRRHQNDRIRPPYEVSIPNSRDPLEHDDDRGYEMIEEP